jgi:serine phosphatase RsbU (regulator of sigma subunit)
MYGINLISCGLNDTFALSGQNKYATAIVLSFHRITGRLVFSNAGHLSPFWYHGSAGVPRIAESREA